MFGNLLLLASGFLLGNDEVRNVVSKITTETVKQGIDLLNKAGEANVQETNCTAKKQQ